MGIRILRVFGFPFAVILLAGCGKAVLRNEAPAIELGQVWKGQRVPFHIQLSNQGARALDGLSFRCCCHCLSLVDPPTRVESGQTLTMRAEFFSQGIAGEVSKEIRLETPGHPLAWRVHANVAPAVDFSNPSRISGPGAASIALRAQAPNLVLDKIESSRPDALIVTDWPARLKRGEIGKVRFEVHPRATEGPFQGSLHFLFREPPNLDIECKILQR